jgi:16S rRNA (uracil1498-N3)-methyltransferase
MRFYLPASAWPADDAGAQLDEAESRHAAAVLRVRPGDAVDVFDGAGRSAPAVVTEAGKKGVRLRLGAVRHAAPPTSRLLLAVAVPKGSIIEWIIEKAVELGASEIIPLLTQRTVVRLDPAERTERQRKWERVAIEACKQCGQNWLPRVHPPRPLTEALAAAPPADFHWPLVACLQPDAWPLGDVLHDRATAHPTDPRRKDAAVWIGPEGDFTPDEYAQLHAAGLLSVTLGPIILRVETASLFCLSVLRHQAESPR